MKVLDDIAGLNEETRPVAAALGVFDGVHKGHMRVLNRTIESAATASGSAWVLTFDPHPLKVIRPDSAPPLLTSKQHKLRLLESLGIHGCAILVFTEEFAQIQPDTFMKMLRNSAPLLQRIYVGQNWRFGRDGRGDVDLLKKLGNETGIDINVVSPAMWQEEIISSTRIRESIINGALDSAAAMLGRKFSILGTVAKGHGVGRKLGYPTANLDPHNEIHPPHGVYAVDAVLEGEKHRAVMNIGMRPTFASVDNVASSLELHVPGIDRSLYGTDIEVVFRKHLRDEMKFSSHADLKHQIAADIEQAASY